MVHISKNNKEYPKEFNGLPQPPKELFIEGNLSPLLDKPKVAIVGSRRASAYGRAVTEQFAKRLAARGIVIVSGLALGVDSIAHQAALDAGGLTIAILPSGLDNIYPSSHFGLAKKIIKQNGALVSEYPPKTIAFKANFIARNRLIAGLSSVVLITEAAASSGSLHTANFAIEQGTEVMVVPGPITSPTSAGCNNLIKSGATPATSADDILNYLKIDSLPSNEHEIYASNPSEHAILKLLKSGQQEGSYLLSQSGLTAEDFNQTMSMLEITGRIKAAGGDNWTLQ